MADRRVRSLRDERERMLVVLLAARPEPVGIEPFGL